jgi:hypothetical protein
VILIDGDKMSKKICQYLIFTFAVTYWGFDIFLSGLGLYEHPTYTIGLIFYIIAACAPAISVYILIQNAMCFISLYW